MLRGSLPNDNESESTLLSFSPNEPYNRLHYLRLGGERLSRLSGERRSLRRFLMSPPPRMSRQRLRIGGPPRLRIGLRRCTCGLGFMTGAADTS